MKKLLIGLLGVAVIGTGGYAAAAGLSDADPARTVSLPGATTSDDTSTTTGRTTTGTTTAATTTAAAADDDIVVGSTPVAGSTGVDISGPCDEAEHADDPRCTGVGGADDDDDDRSGSNSGRSGDDDDHDDDRSGSNSGSDHDDDDNDDNDD